MSNLPTISSAILLYGFSFSILSASLLFSRSRRTCTSLVKSLSEEAKQKIKLMLAVYNLKIVTFIKYYFNIC